MSSSQPSWLRSTATSSNCSAYRCQRTACDAANISARGRRGNLFQDVRKQSAKSRPVRISGQLSISQLAEKLGIRRQWFLEQIKKGTIRIEKDASTRCYLFPDQPETLSQIRLLYEGKTQKLVY